MSHLYHDASFTFCCLPLYYCCFGAIHSISNVFPKFICRMNWINQKYTTQMGKRLFTRRNIGAKSVALVSRNQLIWSSTCKVTHMRLVFIISNLAWAGSFYFIGTGHIYVLHFSFIVYSMILTYDLHAWLMRLAVILSFPPIWYAKYSCFAGI